MIENLINKILEGLYIWTQNKYAEFTKKLNKQLEVKKKIFLKFANIEKNKEEKNILEPQN